MSNRYGFAGVGEPYERDWDVPFWLPVSNANRFGDAVADIVTVTADYADTALYEAVQTAEKGDNGLPVNYYDVHTLNAELPVPMDSAVADVYKELFDYDLGEGWMLVEVWADGAFDAENEGDFEGAIADTMRLKFERETGDTYETFTIEVETGETLEFYNYEFVG